MAVLMLARATFPPAPTSSTAARRFVVDRLVEWGAGTFTDDAAVMVSELVSNVVAHAGTDAEVEARFDDGLLHVTVSDRSSELPVGLAAIPLDAPPDASHGRGLLILAALADAWDVEQTADGKAVWFEIGGRGPRPG